jgi:hypothetical protein
MGIKKAQFDVLKRLGVFWITVKRVVMAGKWSMNQKRAWEESGTGCLCRGMKTGRLGHRHGQKTGGSQDETGRYWRVDQTSS